MKNIIFTLASLILMVSHSFAAGTNVNTATTVVKKTIVAEKSLTPTQMQTSFTIENDGKEVAGILKSFASSNNSILELTKKETIRCVGGQNRIVPKYAQNLDKKLRVFDGYSGSLTYTCTFEDIQVFNTLLDTSFGHGQKLNLSPVVWVVSDESIKKAEKDLEKDLVNSALTSVKEYESLLKTRCELHSLEIFSGSSKKGMLFSAKAERVAHENFQPIVEDIPMNLSGNIEIFCKNIK